MIEQVVKVFELLGSTKSVARVVVGAASALTTLYFAHQRIVKESTAIGFSQEVATILVLMLASGVGFLVVDLVVWTGKKAKGRWSKYREETKKKNEAEEKKEAFIAKFQSTLPHFSDESLEILFRSLAGPVEGDRDSIPLRTLYKHGFLLVDITIDSYVTVFVINPIVSLR